MAGNAGKKGGRAALAAALASCMMMSGCGSTEENTALGMEALKALDYQSAISYFDNARAAGEEGKELARAEGIAYLGMTQYSQAADCF
ncbi:MAG: hypothetical protein K2K19_03375, partial [Acetatifactor sp.]|nr:hypothetical protein [Acetatifactor sp.]